MTGVFRGGTLLAYSDGLIAMSFPDAPQDGNIYGRQSGAWVQVLGLTGGSLAGPGNLAVGGTLGVTGAATFTAGVALNGSLNTVNGTLDLTNANQLQLDGAVGSQRQISYTTAGVLHWIIACYGAEGGSNNGGDLTINAYADSTGTYITSPITIKRSTGVVTFAAAIVNGPSDRSLKENITPLEGSLDKVLALQGVSFNMIGDETKRRQIGLIAQDVAPVVPEVIQDFRSTIPADDEKSEPVEVHKLALDYPKLTALLIESVKELTARVESLEAKPA